MSTTSSDNPIPQLPPPAGDHTKAASYIIKLIELIDTDKLDVSHTDLARFDPTALQDHYRLDLKNYEVEVSHTKEPNTGKDFYVILFNNLKYLSGQCSAKVILAYMHLSEDQFKSFKSAFTKQVNRKKKAEEEKRLKEAMTPIDQALEELSASPLQTNNSISLPVAHS